MAKDKVGKTLSSLLDVDKEIQEHRVNFQSMGEKEKGLSTELAAANERLGDLKAAFEEVEARQKAEESRLREEETKIIERRKQLTTIGGAKSAKLVERELDIATRVLETMEKSAMEAMEAAESLRDQLSDVSDRASGLQQELDSVVGENKPHFDEIDKALTKLTKQRETLLGKLEVRLQGLYNRVNERYPGSAISLADEGACTSCYRALPQQIYNQVMAGNVLIQCPGCSRILIYSLD